ncbi:hypothetical protein MWU52_01415 [Jannaschia sp. S6380]|jgi:hypothetical protein|uniref:hypothetical protein n=1 Tax=Jannaschia sp. S6380 TaxID=2926408 RepID=UPI001FF6A687|nr:hypothetical protein [Jannaschia sp. S6380]MCK0166203.1 hypothetical protein [Jannaschia sp. S6380]
MTKKSTGLCAAILALAATGVQADQHRMDNTMGQPGMMGGGMMPGMTMAMMDSDGDGMLSREEAQAVHDRMFSMADADGDGAVTMEEMHAMMGGGMMGMDGASQ